MRTDEAAIDDQPQLCTAPSGICGLSVSELKQLIVSRGLDHSDCIERADLIRSAHETAARSNQSGDSADICTLPIAALKDLIVAHSFAARRLHRTERLDPEGARGREAGPCYGICRRWPNGKPSSTPPPPPTALPPETATAHD